MKRTSKLPMTLLPKVPGLKLEDVVINAGSISLALVSTSLPVACPMCGRKTARLHSHYRRTVADLPWSGRHVRLLLSARKFRCPNRECPRKVFTERLPDLIEPYARKTIRLHEVLELVGFALGGNAAARLIRRLGMTASPTTLLRYIRDAAIGDHPPPEVIGIDDSSLRRGKKAATIIVDLERHSPVELLPDCSAATLASWLQANPSAQTISRDGSREYARGIALGAPEALQVADRWHLLKNLREVLEKVLERDQKLLVVRGETFEEAHNEANEHARPVAHADEDGRKDISLDDVLGSYSWANRKELRRRQQRRAARLEQYQRAIEFKERGMTTRDISDEVGVGVRTLYRWFAAGAFPEKQPRRDKGPRLPTRVADHLVRRWNEGCHNVQKIYRELRQDGYDAPMQTIYYFARYLRVGLVPPGYTSAPTKGSPKKSKEQRLSPRSGGWALMLPAEKLTPKQRRWIGQLHEGRSAHGASIHRLARRFVEMVQEGKVAELEEWLVDAQNSGVGELKSFAEGICSRNLSAVRAALTEVWSNGQVEGQINRLKMLKRQSYGRAGFELLRARVLQRTA
jgi:transposase